MSLAYHDFEAQHATLVASTDTPFTPSRIARAFRVLNWDTTARVLVKRQTITSDTDAAATRVGAAGATNFPQVRVFPVQVGPSTDVPAVHLRSAAASEVTVEFFF